MFRVAVGLLALAFVAGLWIPSPAWAQDLNVKVVSLSSHVKVGDTATLTVSTTPGARCTPDLQSKSGVANMATKITGLHSKTADANGTARWSWKVPPGTSAGSWPIEVTCSLSGRHGKADTYVTVQ